MRKRRALERCSTAFASASPPALTDWLAYYCGSVAPGLSHGTRLETPGFPACSLLAAEPYARGAYVSTYVYMRQ